MFQLKIFIKLLHGSKKRLLSSATRAIQSWIGACSDTHGTDWLFGFIYLNGSIKGSLMYKTVYFIVPSIIIV